MKPIATVQLPIAKFVLNVLERSDDHELATWIRAFTRSLANCDPSLDDFAAELLNDVNEYRKEDARRKREKRKFLSQQSSHEEERLDEDSPVARTVECKTRRSGDTTKASPTYSAPPKFNALEAVESFARNDEEQEVLTEFVKMRLEKKKPISRIAFNALAKKLGDLSVDDSVASVRKSIENDWQGVFPESLKPRTSEREKSGAEKFTERVLREDLEEKNRQLKLKNEVKYELNPESPKPRTFEREKSGAEKFMERVLREDLEEKNRQLKRKDEVKYEFKGS